MFSLQDDSLASRNRAGSVTGYIQGYHPSVVYILSTMTLKGHEFVRIAQSLTAVVSRESKQICCKN